MIRFALPVILIAPLLLTACSAEYEWEKRYANQTRTAGGVVSYVRVKIMPKKELKLVSEVAKAIQGDDKHAKAVEKMEKMFGDHQRK